MKKGILSVLLGICVVSSVSFCGMHVSAAETIVYQQNFDSTPVGEVPDEVTVNIAAPLVENAGFVAVTARKEGDPDRALRSNHQTTAGGTNSATITLPEPVHGAFRLEADFRIGSTVKREFEVLTPDNKTLFRVGLAAYSKSNPQSEKQLYAWVNKTTTDLTDIDFTFANNADYHFTFDVNPETQTVRLTVDGNGNRARTAFDISGSGVAAENIGLGAMKISTYFNNKVGSPGRFLQIDNIVVRQPAFDATFDGDASDSVVAGNTEISVTVSLTELAESAEPTLLYLLYDENGVLSNVDVAVYAAGAEGGYTKTLTYDSPIPAGCRLKVFAWGAMGSMTPVGSSVEF